MEFASQVDFERLHSFANELQRATSFSELLHCIDTEVRAVLGYRQSWLVVFDPVDPTLARLVETVGDHTELVLRHCTVIPTIGDRMMDEIRASRGPVIVTDARTDPRTNKAMVERLGNRTILNVPLVLTDMPLGCLGTGTFAPEECREPTRTELDYLVALAARVASTVERLCRSESRERLLRSQFRVGPTAQVRTLDLRELVARTVRTLGDLLGDSVELSVDRGEDAAFVDADEAVIAPLIAHVALDACEALSNGGRVAITTRRVVRDAPDGSERRSFVVVGFRPSSADPERVEALRTQFERAQPDAEDGTLATDMSSTLRRLGGFIEVTHGPGRGASLLVHFPTTKHGATQRASSGWETVLLVEDDGATRGFVAEALRGCGYTVFEAADGAQALRILGEFPRRIDLMVSDVVLPGINGFELAEQLLAVSPSLRVLFMSGYVGELRPTGKRGVDAERLLAKPFTAADLASRVRGLLDATSDARA
ncbi:MAG: response regulator [Planctomycetes bacterium]|nr:response regulator [Planctomycetota bacterium]